MEQEEKDQLYNALMELAHEIDRLQGISVGKVSDSLRIKIDFLINSKK
jgi:hypothetical protein